QTPPLMAWPSKAQQAKIADAQRELDHHAAVMTLIDTATEQRPPRPRTALTEESPPLCVTWQLAYQQSRQRVEALKAEIENVRAQTPKVMVMEDMTQPRKSFMFDRGLYNQPLQEVTAAPPAFLPNLIASSEHSYPQTDAFEHNTSQ